MRIGSSPDRLASDGDIETCYRLLLGREPDPEGFAAWRELVRKNRITVRQLFRSFTDSPEYSGRGVKTSIQYGRPFLMPAFESIYPEDGRYEPHVYGPLMEQLRPGVTFLDIGANIGLFSVLGALKGARVIAVEPQPINTRLILANARANQVSVELHPVAASDRHGYALMPVNEATSNARIAAGIDPLEAHVVPLAPLDTLINEPVDLLKIDVEGFEHKALMGGRQLLERCKPVIVTEYSPELQKAGGSTGKAYLDFLLGFGYSVSVLRSDRSREKVGGTVEVDRCWYEARKAGLTHIDLLLTP